MTKERDMLEVKSMVDLVLIQKEASGRRVAGEIRSLASAGGL